MYDTEPFEELAVPEFSRAYNHDTMRPERSHEEDTPTDPYPDSRLD